MNGNGIQAPDVNELAYARGVFGYGNHDGGSARYAGHGSNAARIDALGQRAEDQADCTRGILSQQFQTISSQFENATRDRQFGVLQSELFQSELRTRDLIDAQSRDNNARFTALDKCCCDARLQACQDKAELKAEIQASEARSVERQLNAANAELTALKTQVACGCTTGCSRPCPGC